MKKVMEKLSENIDETYAATLKEKCQNFISEHPELISLLLLAIACLLFLFWGLNFYPLMDVDETRYAVIARDMITANNWNNLILNGIPFLEKPPLYFWFVAASIKLFQGFTAFAVRFPIALLSSTVVFATYYFGKKVISRKFGVISALILLSSFFFLLLSHIAILDMVLTVFMTLTIYCAILTNFCQEKNKKFYWWYAYAFMGAGFLAKGILALAIPAVIILTYSILTKTFKQLFKPIYILPGIALFLISILPWHLIMYKEYGQKFIYDYFIVHHFARLMGAEVIGRERPFWYFVPVFLMGFLPWSFAFINFVYDGFKKLGAKYKSLEGKVTEKLFATISATTNEQKLILFASLYFIIVFLVFSSSGTKLPTYILPAFPAASLLVGYYWWEASERNEHEKGIYVSTLTLTSILIFACLGFTFSYAFIPDEVRYGLNSFHNIAIFAIYLICILMILRLNTKKALSIFLGYIVFMFFVITLSVTYIFNFVYSTGQSELVEYSRISTLSEKPSKLIAFDFAVKPSILVEKKGEVEFMPDPEFDKLNKVVDSTSDPVFVIIKNKNFNNDPKYFEKMSKKLKPLKVGQRYSLLTTSENYIITPPVQGEFLINFSYYNTQPQEKRHKSKRHKKH